jgi:hypothetical protein
VIRPAFVVAFASLLACKGSEPTPEVAGDPSAPAAPQAKPVAAPPPPPSPASDVTSTSSSTSGVEIEEPPAEPVAPAIEPPPAPEVETHVLGPEGDPLLQLLGKGVPEAVELIAVHEHGRERIALYRLDVAQQWAAGQGDPDALLEPYEQLIEACTSSYGEVVADCVVERAAELPGVPADVVAYHASESAAFELAHVKLDSDTKGTVLARARLYDYGYGYACAGEDCFETKLKVYDMDGDGRSEILAVFPLEILSDLDLGDKAEAALAFVLDKSDLHVQFATTRNFFDEGGDLSFHTSDFQTTFVTRDTDSDGHADLVVREVGRESRTPGEEEEDQADAVTRTDRSITCPWERAGDRWVCPDKIGTQLIDGSKRVELTRVPLPPPAVKPAD